METSNIESNWDNQAFAQFIEEHLHDNVAMLRLKKWKPLPFPVDLAITQIETRKKIICKITIDIQ